MGTRYKGVVIEIDFSTGLSNSQESIKIGFLGKGARV